MRIKSKDEKGISAICDHMDIQVDNPVNVLTQGGCFFLLVF